MKNLRVICLLAAGLFLSATCSAQSEKHLREIRGFRAGSVRRIGQKRPVCAGLDGRRRTDLHALQLHSGGQNRIPPGAIETGKYTFRSFETDSTTYHFLNRKIVAAAGIVRLHGFLFEKKEFKFTARLATAVYVKQKNAGNWLRQTTRRDDFIHPQKNGLSLRRPVAFRLKNCPVGIESKTSDSWLEVPLGVEDSRCLPLGDGFFVDDERIGEGLKKNVVPWPSTDWNQMRPPYFSVRLLQMESPMPVPSYLSLLSTARKNRLKIFSRCFSLIPMPLSRTMNKISLVCGSVFPDDLHRAVGGLPG